VLGARSCGELRGSPSRFREEVACTEKAYAMKIIRLGLLAAALVAAGSLVAVALPQDPLTPQAEPAPKPCEPPASRPNTASNSGEPSCQSNGVIKPPQTGDRSVLAPPDQGTASMPVIPPPGTPGGDPTVKPK
jgi:hypothetical protein